MKTLINILFGVFVGITISSFFVLRSNSQSAAQIVAKDLPVKDLELRTKYTPRPQVTPKKVVKESPVEKPKVLDLTINEQVVDELEKNWDGLRSQIQVSTETRGFRVNYLAENSAFLQAGLQTGDLISYEALKQMQNADAESRQLAERVVRIFEHVR